MAMAMLAQSAMAQSNVSPCSVLRNSNPRGGFPSSPITNVPYGGADDSNGTMSYGTPISGYTFAGNGIPDSAEFAIMHLILSDISFDNGIITYAEVNAAFTANFNLVMDAINAAGLASKIGGTTDPFSSFFPSSIAMLLTIGDGDYTVVSTDPLQITAYGFSGMAAMLFAKYSQQYGTALTLLDLGATVSIPELAITADSDGDGFDNACELTAWKPWTCNEKVTCPYDIGYKEGVLDPLLVPVTCGVPVQDLSECQYPGGLPEPTGSIIHVDRSATGTADGSSWANAFTTIQTAIDAAAAGDEIWVAEGTYNEPRTGNGSVIVNKSVFLYGGFDGTETLRSERNPDPENTIIDGSTARGGLAAYTVLRVLVDAVDATIDGFTITGGNDPRSPSLSQAYVGWGGVVVYSPSCVFSNCKIVGNSGYIVGGLLIQEGCFVTIDNCEISDNDSNGGPGGIRGFGNSVNITNTVIANNTGSGTTGARLLDSRFRMEKCIVRGNQWAGIEASGYFKAIDCVFDGGGNNAELLEVTCNAPFTVLLKNSVFCGAGDRVPFTKTGTGTLEIEHCNFWGTGLSSIVMDVSGGLNYLRNSDVSNGDSPALPSTDPPAITASDSNIGGGYPGVNITSVEPHFRDPDNGNFRHVGQELVDVGASTSIAEDIRGAVRTFGGAPDLGAFEFIDEDGDDMEDEWEELHGLDSDDPDDAIVDSDVDGFDNYTEFLYDTDPQDEDDPITTFYVDATGDDETGDGTSGAPWQTIGKALSEGAKLPFPFTVDLSEGNYNEQVVMPDNATIRGEDNATTRIQYYNASDDEHFVVKMGEKTVLDNVLVSIPGQNASVIAVIVMEEVEAHLTNCVVSGNDNLFSIGALVSGEGTSGGSITDCEFMRLQFGIQAVNTDIEIARNGFDDIRADAIFVREPETKGLTVSAPNMGDEANGGGGGNVFGFVSGKFIINLTNNTLKAENNDWGLYTVPAIAAKMTGNVDFEPFVNAQDPEGDVDGEGDDLGEGEVEGSVDGEGIIEGSVDGEGVTEGTAEGEGEAEGVGDGEGDSEGEGPMQSADQNGDQRIDLTEALRVVQLFNAGHFQCGEETEDGFQLGEGNIECTAHSSDYAPQDWVISLSELLRLIQFYNIGVYYPCPDASEDNFCLTR
jgi:hypothetical protein